MRMILLHVDEATPVYVNPQLIRAVSPFADSQSLVSFDQEHSILVKETAEAVAHAIENVR